MLFALLALKVAVLIFQLTVAKGARLTNKVGDRTSVSSSSSRETENTPKEFSATLLSHRHANARILNESGLQDVLDSAGTEENDKSVGGKSQHHCAKQGLSTFFLQLRTDAHANGISWLLQSKKTGEILASADVGTYQDREEYAETICVPAKNECLSFVIRNERGDGSCCPVESGFYYVWLDNVIIGSSDGSLLNVQDLIDFGNCVDNDDKPEGPTNTDTTSPQQNSTQQDSERASSDQNTTDSNLEEIINLPQGIVCGISDYSLKLEITTKQAGNNSFVQFQDMKTNRTVYRDDSLESFSTSSLHFCLPGKTCYNATIHNSAAGSFSLEIDSHDQDTPNRSYSSGSDTADQNSMITVSKIFGDCEKFIEPPPDSASSELDSAEKVFFPPFRIALTFTDDRNTQNIEMGPQALSLVESATTSFLDYELHRIYSDRYLFTDLTAALPLKVRRKRLIRAMRYLDMRELQQLAPYSTEVLIEGAAFFEVEKAPTQDGLRAEMENSFESSEHLTKILKEVGYDEFDTLQEAKAFFPDVQLGETGSVDNHETKLPSRALVIAICVSAALAFSALIAATAVLGARRREERLKSHGIKSLGTATPSFSLASLGGSHLMQNKKDIVQVEKAPSDAGLCNMEQGCSSSINVSSSPSIDDYFEDVVEADASKGRKASYSKACRIGSITGSHFFSKEASKLEKSALGIKSLKVVQEKPDDADKNQFRREDFEHDNDFGRGGTMYL